LISKEFKMTENSGVPGGDNYDFGSSGEARGTDAIGPREQAPVSGSQEREAVQAPSTETPQRPGPEIQPQTPWAAESQPSPSQARGREAQPPFAAAPETKSSTQTEVPEQELGTIETFVNQPTNTAQEAYNLQAGLIQYRQRGESS